MNFSDAPIVDEEGTRPLPGAADAQEHAEPKQPPPHKDDAEDAADNEDDDEEPDEDEDDAEEHIRKADEPTAADVHSDAPLGTGTGRKTRRRSHYMRAFMDSLRAAFTTKPYVSGDELAGIMAESHKVATRKGIAEARRTTEPYPFKDLAGSPWPWEPGGTPVQTTPLADLHHYADQNINGDDAPNPLDLCASCKAGDAAACTCAACERGDYPHCSCAPLRVQGTSGLKRMTDPILSDTGERFDLFLPTEFAEPPLWIPYMPKPGTFKHARYGEVKITPERNAAIVKNFSDGVYQRQLPLDAEHQSKLSGAVGWIREMRQNADDSVDARVDWTDRGTALIGADRFKFISPEFYESWEQPETGRRIAHVAIGGAITTRPFFKESALRPLVASEAGMTFPDDPTVPAVAGREFPVSDEQTTTDPRQFAELEARLAESERQNKQFVEESRVANERIYALEVERARKAFTEEGEALHTVPVADYVACMEALEPEQREPVRALITTLARKIEATEPLVFKVYGKAGRGESGAEGRLAAAKQAAKAANPGLTDAQAFSEALSANPDLYEDYLAQG